MDKIFQVSEFNEFINIYLNQIEEVIVEGEISEINISQNKWLFMTIKDEESSTSIFGITYQLPGYDLLEEGMLVHVYGTPRLYKKTGKFSLFASDIKPAGEGSLKLVLEKLQKKLEKEGLFAPERKRSIPEFPARIGLITAKGSRAYGDFTKILKERMGGIKIYFYPVQVQGKKSIESILEAFKFFNQKLPDLDLLVLTRGGGSLEDLISFNDERIARAIFSSKNPVVCGIGHEEDFSIADYVADLRASTPSNAAELIVKDKQVVKDQVFYSVNSTKSSLDSLLNLQKSKTIRQISLLSKELEALISNFKSTINNFIHKFSLYRQSFLVFRQNFTRQIKDTQGSVQSWIEREKFSTNSLIRLIKSLNPKQALKRGFSLTRLKNGKLVRSVKDVQSTDILITTLTDGKITSEAK